MEIYVLDTETTGIDPDKDRVVEVAAVEVAVEIGGGGNVVTGWSSFVDPGIPIPPEASAIHHIIDADVAGAPHLGRAVDVVLGLNWQDRVDIVAAHNARFDRSFLPPLKDKRWIDTWRCALHVWPDAPNHKNMTLRYWLGIDLPRDGAHRALADAIVTANLLCRLLKERSVDDLIKLSTKAAVLRKVTFGKHAGKLWADVPTDYLQWGSKQEFDPDVKHTIKHELARRTAAK